MKIDIKNCLEFFDNTSDQDRGNPNSIVSIIGEDLAAAAFKHFSENNRRYLYPINELKERKFQAIRFPPGKGPRLDRWLYNKHKNELYQCEIKFWSSTAIKGFDYKLKSTETEINILRTAKQNWERQKRGHFQVKDHPNKVTKVLERMRIPQNIKKPTIKPLLIYWAPMSNTTLKPIFNVRLSSLNKSIKTKIKTDFNSLCIFSVSLYFRDLLKNGIGKINFDMPDTKRRMKILKSLGMK